MVTASSINEHAFVDRSGEFGRKAALLGHNLSALRGGHEERIYFTSESVEDLGRVLRNASLEEVRERHASFFQPLHQARQRLGQGVHDRAEAYIFAGGELTEYDRAGIARHLPLHAQSIAVAEKVVSPGECWDLSLRGDRWKLDYRDELYSCVNVGRLILYPGASVVVQGNVLALLCQEYICLGSPDDYQIGILPTPFSVDFGFGPHHGESGRRGAHGVDARSAEVVMAEPHLLGYVIRGAHPAGEGAGADGQDGEEGRDGKHGRNGGMCYLAELTFRSVSGPVTVFGRAGEGGVGGRGGDGGNGGSGGKGRDGYPLLTGKLLPAPGGKGGNGGQGGRGGHGGSGGISSNIYISVPAECEPQVLRWSEPSIGGAGGLGGEGGHPGRGGAGGIARHFPWQTGPGQDGREGEPGRSGRDGRGGRSRPGPIIFLNNRPPWSSGVTAKSKVS